jgi:hypothetical protein
MTFATPTGAVGSGPSLVEPPVSVEHELEALHEAMEHTRHAPMADDDFGPAFESFLAALTRWPEPQLARAS